MIKVSPEAALEIVEARAFYERAGVAAAFVEAVVKMLDDVEARAASFPHHPFAATPGTRRALVPKPWPFAFALVIIDGVPHVLACEHLRRFPAYWESR